MSSVEAEFLEGSDWAAEPTGTAGAHERRVGRNRRLKVQFIASCAIIVVIVLVSLLAPLLAPYSPITENFTARYLPPLSAGHLLGTDAEGRDVLSRLIWGGRITLLVSFLATSVAVAVGTTLGLVSAFCREWLSNLIMRTIDLLLAFPVIMVALSLAEVIGSGVGVIGISIIVAATPYVARITFGESRRERNKEYVEAARAFGASSWAVLVKEVLPNISTSVLVYWSSLIGITTVFASSLSAIGVGVQPPTPDWGQMIQDGSEVLLSGKPWNAIFPGLAVLVVGLAFNWLGDGIRDLLDPQSAATV